jgi:hypothetical protein
MVVSIGVLLAVAFAMSKAWLSRMFLDDIVRAYPNNCDTIAV